MLKRKRGAFTLIELLVVVAIIGILAGVLLPALGMVKERARQATCKSTIGNMVTALEGYTEDWGEYPPDKSDGTYANDGVTTVSTTALVFFLDGDPQTKPAAAETPRTGYFAFDFDQIVNNEFIGPWGLPYTYNELEHDRSATRPAGSGKDVDPTQATVNGQQYDIWVPHDSDPPADWPTNYRSD